MLSRRNFLSSAVATGAGGLLAACAGTTTPPTPINPQPVINLLQQVLGFLQTTCRVVADANAVSALIQTFPVGTAALLIANAVCAVISQTPTTSFHSGRRLRGALTSVTIDGTTFPAAVVHGVAVPYALIGTPLAVRLRAHPLSCVVVNGVCVPVAPNPFHQK